MYTATLKVSTVIPIELKRGIPDYNQNINVKYDLLNKGCNDPEMESITLNFQEIQRGYHYHSWRQSKSELGSKFCNNEIAISLEANLLDG